MRALSYSQHVLVTGVASGLSAPAYAELAWLQADVSNIRYRLDGGTPTASNGHLMRNNEPPIEIVSDFSQIVVIPESAGAKLLVTYFG